MLFALLNAGIIYGLLWVFERGRREFDDFDVPYVATVRALDSCTNCSLPRSRHWPSVVHGLRTRHSTSGWNWRSHRMPTAINSLRYGVCPKRGLRMAKESAVRAATGH
jgi:hypothetical protein